jgi:hypothetical protein
MLDNKDYQQNHQRFLGDWTPVKFDKIAERPGIPIAPRVHLVLACDAWVHTCELQDWFLEQILGGSVRSEI